LPLRSEYWISTLDEAGGRLLCFRRAGGGRWSFEEVSNIVNKHRQTRIHERTAMLGRTGEARPQLASLPHETEEDRRRFANEAAAWLMDAMRWNQVDSVDLFAPGRMLHDLRDEWPRDRRGSVVDHEGELTNIPLQELAQHPAIVLVLGLSSAGRHGG
jgi:hypothetical protein